MDGSVAPSELPLLPGPKGPSNAMMGKWKVVIHPVGLKFLKDAKVLVNGRYTGEKFHQWMLRTPDAC